jgi:hypothetical protein
MKLTRHLGALAVAASLALVGAPAALAATSHAAAPAATSSAAAPAVPRVPGAYKWLQYNHTWYGSLQACRTAGDNIKQNVNSSYTFRCVGHNGGDYIYYILWVGIPE